MSKNNCHRKLAEVGALLDESRQRTRHLFQSQKSEKHALEKMLHDDLGQALVAIKSFAFAISNLEDNKTHEAQELAGFITEIADTAYLSTYDLMREVRAELYSCNSLTEGIEYCFNNSRLANKGITHRLSVSGDVNNLDDYVRTASLRSIQECLTKAIRRGEVSHVEIAVRLINSTRQEQQSYPLCTGTAQERRIPNSLISSSRLIVEVQLVSSEPLDAKAYQFETISNRMLALGADLRIEAIKTNILLVSFALHVDHQEDKSTL